MTPRNTQLPLPFRKHYRVVIESPYAGDIERNMQYLDRCMEDCIWRGESPYASHFIIPRFLDDADPPSRLFGLEAGHAWGLVADYIAVYTDLGISEGMQAAITHYTAHNKTIVYRSLDGDDDPYAALRAALAMIA